MSGEQITEKNLDKYSNLDNQKTENKRVNINHLLSKVREEKNKKKKENYMFLGLIVGTLTVTGIIVSL
tara:strand:+ start:39 stop:242 length:204 start_codon:yes stop_codon:yes gene_type:complete